MAVENVGVQEKWKHSGADHGACCGVTALSCSAVGCVRAEQPAVAQSLGLGLS